MTANPAPAADSVRFGIIGVGIIGRQHAQRLTGENSPPP